MKRLLKKILPRTLIAPLLRPYHLLRAVAANVRYGFPARRMKVIGITGTNGKTTSANYLAGVLTEAGYTVGVSTTANFQIGDESWDNELNMTTTNPFALQKLLRRMKRAHVDWVILEVTSHALDQYRVWGVPIHTAVMTNLTPDHLDYHKTVEAYARTKAKLLHRAKTAVALNHDDEWYDYFMQYSRRAVYSYGENKAADVRVDRLKLRGDGTQARFRYGQRIMNISLQLPGKFNVYNALAAATVAFGLEIEWKAVERGLERLGGVPGRMEPILAGQGFSVIVDYAHTPDAFANVFSTLRPITEGRIIAVFGGAPMHDYKTLGKVAAEYADVVYVTNDEPLDTPPAEIRRDIISAAHSAGAKELHEFAFRREAIETAFADAKPGDTVVLLCLGHQKYRRMKGGKKITWDDRRVARESLAKLADSKS